MTNLNPLNKSGSLYQTIRKFYRSLATFAKTFVCYVFNLFPLEDKVVFSNFFGRGYGDNGKYTVEKMLELKVPAKIIWLIKDENLASSKFPEGVIPVRYNSIRSLYELCTAKIWFDNCRKEFIPPKRKRQTYIQTWHGGVAMKKVEKDAEATLSPEYKRQAINDSKAADYLVSNCTFATESYKTSFWFSHEILETGYPRNDALMNPNPGLREKVLSVFKIDPSKKIVLYAPTFRSNKDLSVYDLDYPRLIQALNQRFTGDFTVLLRLHPYIAKLSANLPANGPVVNASYYDDMQELLAISDVLITDYSSTMFEFMLTKRPVFLYARDVIAYKQERDTYFDIEKLPYPLGTDNDSMMDKILHFDEALYLKGIDAFTKELGFIEVGQSSYKIVQKIIERLKL